MIQEEPVHGPALNSLGSELAESGRDEEAVGYFTRAAAVDPNDARAQFNLGVLGARRGRDDEAVPRLRAAVGLSPKMTEARVALALALALERQGQPELAIEHFEAAVRLLPADPDAHNEMGIVFGGVGRFDEAIREFTESVRLAPDPAVQANLDQAQRLRAGTGGP